MRTAYPPEYELPGQGGKSPFSFCYQEQCTGHCSPFENKNPAKSLLPGAAWGTWSGRLDKARRAAVTNPLDSGRGRVLGLSPIYLLDTGKE